MNDPTSFPFACPRPSQQHEHILLAHGGGGVLMHNLLRDVFFARLDSDRPGERHDAAVLPALEQRLAFTTDSYVVRPLFFPGGDIGSLAVHGTLNDLAMSGARPLALSAAFILEEGFPIDQLERIVDSLAAAARASNVPVVTGDTKVVDRGKGDGVYINTAGVGAVAPNADVRPRRIRAGDVLLVNGDLGRHGIAVMATREGLEFETKIDSDSAPVVDPVMRLIDAGIPVHCLRDLTRGGLASALNELVADCDCGFELDESEIPVRSDVQSACELLGFDPLYVACEGRFVAFIPADHAERALELLRDGADGEHARIIGQVVDGPPRVALRTRIGATRIVDMLSGQQLPRIC